MTGRTEASPDRAHLEQHQDEYEVYYDNGVRALQQQQSVLDGLRTRAATLISAAAIATSFLGAQALRGADVPNAAAPAIHIWGWLAIGMFGALGLLIVGILLPWPGWRFSLDLPPLVTWTDTSGSRSRLPELYRRLALSMDRTVERNNGILERLYWALRVACVLLVAEVVAWIVDIGNGVAA